MYNSRKSYRKRTSRKNKKTYGGFKGKSVRGDYNTNWTKRQLNVYLHPFSTSTVGAKIPDGKVTISSAQRRQKLVQLDTSETGVTAAAPGTGKLWIALLPGYNVPMIWANGTAPAAGAWNQVLFDPLPGAAGDTLAQRIAADTVKPREFRIVSTGIKIALTNNNDSNNGYWEAIRMPTDTDSIAALTTSVIAYITGMNDSFIDHPTYCTGRLKDIHKYIFQTKPDGNSHNLINWQSWDSADSNQDALIIKITGRPTGSADDATKVNCHVVSNQEVVYAPTSTFHRFMTESTYDSRFDVAVHANAINIKAATRAYVNT